MEIETLDMAFECFAINRPSGERIEIALHDAEKKLERKAAFVRGGLNECLQMLEMGSGIVAMFHQVAYMDGESLRITPLGGRTTQIRRPLIHVSRIGLTHEDGCAYAATFGVAINRDFVFPMLEVRIDHPNVGRRMPDLSEARFG
jgi:hypothetical protein